MRPSRPHYVPVHARYVPPPFVDAQEVKPLRGVTRWIVLFAIAWALGMLLLAAAVTLMDGQPAQRSPGYVEPSPYGPPPQNGFR